MNKSNKENQGKKLANDVNYETLDVEDINLSEDKEIDKEDKVENFTSGVIPQKDLDATRMYLNEIGFSPLLTAEEEVYYGRKAQAGDDEARKRMIESNLRLVVKIARRFNRNNQVWDLGRYLAGSTGFPFFLISK